MGGETLAPPDDRTEELVFSEVEQVYHFFAYAAFVATNSADARVLREMALRFTRSEVSADRQRTIGRMIFKDATRRANGGKYIFGKFDQG